ncbi:Clp protease N-terminal domain-containing protein [Nonomuraea candida]|uniref:Clp protease N-terminal domain-containing protein n=1 Tax=Nonomuraea candida TaxID=359159 RepID=UPI0005B963AD|nr:Clp protease N-terminal domain-containing protein [Nonomuraea candida]
MFQKLTDRARQVVVLSQQEARMLDHGHIGAEHLLLGLIREGQGVGAQVLGSLGMSLEDARRQVEEIAGRGPAAPEGFLPFTPQATEVLQRSDEVAVGLGLDYIGTEHVLLSLVRETEGVAARVLGAYGGERARVGELVGKLVEQYRTGRG